MASDCVRAAAQGVKNVAKALMHRDAGAAVSALARIFMMGEAADKKYAPAWEAQVGHPDAFTVAVKSGALGELARVQARAIEVRLGCTSLPLPALTVT